MSGKTETMEFQAEGKELLDLMIHSIYSNKEIFLRELISNASDALDRLRIESLSNPDILEGDDNLHIRIESDPDKRTLTIHDNGIGMTRAEVVKNIGTIARSGTKELVKKLKNQKGKENEHMAELIGQFGVGFYSAFMVADKITLITRKAGKKTACYWESKGDGKFDVSDAAKEGHGTSITLHLKPADAEDGLDDFSNEYSIRGTVKKYSDFINYPIIMKSTVSEGEGDDQKQVEKDVTLNSMKPIWTRSRSEVKDEEYNEFYKSIAHDWTDPLKIITVKAEGMMEYYSLLFIPSQAPFDFYYQGYQSGLQLYVKRVKIMDNQEDLLPNYLRFVKGVVESSDLPLNISREILQQDRHIKLIQKNLTKKVLSELATMMDKERDKYLTFWSQFGNAIKEGISTDFENKDKLMDLLLFQSTNDDEKLTSLGEYVSRMKADQEEIYYITGDSRDLMENSPHLEIFKKKKYEVLFLSDPVDELVVQGMTEYQGKKLKSVEKGAVDIGSEKEKKKAQEKMEEQKESYGDMLSALKNKLGDKVKEVRLSNRLVSAPACLVTDENDMTPHLEKLLKNSPMAMATPPAQRILEINPDHEITGKLKERYESDPKDKSIDEYAEVLLDYAYLSEGAELPDPIRFNELLVKLIQKSI